MNDRQLQITAYAAAAYLCVTVIIATAALVDQLAHIM
jgi:hypothetical protein